MTTPAQRHQLFISYSHTDREWVDRLQTMIRPLVRSDDLKLWDDSQIPPGARWREEIEKALASAKVALLLVSDEFLASEFVTNKELPPLLEAAEREGLRILWVCLSPCFVEFTPINDFQAVLPPSQVLEGMSPVEQKQALKKVALSVREALSSTAPRLPPRGSPPAGSAAVPPAAPRHQPIHRHPGAGEIVPGLPAMTTAPLAPAPHPRHQLPAPAGRKPLAPAAHHRGGAGLRGRAGAGGGAHDAADSGRHVSDGFAGRRGRPE